MNRTALAFVPNGDIYDHYLTTFFKNQQALCPIVWGGSYAKVSLANHETGNFKVSPVDICLGDDSGTYGATFFTQPPIDADAAVQSYMSDWVVSGFCLRVTTDEWSGETTSDPRITIDETWEIYGDGMPAPF